MKASHRLEQLIQQPQRLFLIDGLGASLSAFLLGIVLVRYEDFFGIPVPTLFLLAALPILFAIYDFLCYALRPARPAQFLRLIALVNLAYCALSLALAFSHLECLTVWGWAYILGEIGIVAVLAIAEWTVAGKMQ